MNNLVPYLLTRSCSLLDLSKLNFRSEDLRGMMLLIEYSRHQYLIIQLIPRCFAGDLLADYTTCHIWIEICFWVALLEAGAYSSSLGLNHSFDRVCNSLEWVNRGN